MDALNLDPASQTDQTLPPDSRLGLKWEVYLHPAFINLWVLEPGGWVCYPFPNTEPYRSWAEALAKC